MRRAALQVGAWLAASMCLYMGLLLLDVYWNLAAWHPRFDVEAVGLIAAIPAALWWIWSLSSATRESWVRWISLLLVTALFALGVYAVPAEPLGQGWFGRTLASPLWYRVGRLAVMSLPGLFWLLRSCRRSRSGDRHSSA
jgi:hypothetical protein